MNCISIVLIPSPLQLSHLPPSTLKEKCFGLYPLILLSLCDEKSFLISSYAFMYVTGLDLDDFPIAF